MTLTIYGLLPSGNVLLRMHWAKRAEVVRRWRMATAGAVLIARVQKANGAKTFHVKATRVASKPLDTCNFATSLDKLVIDGLCKPMGRRRFGLGIIYDDAPQWLTVECLQRKPRGDEPACVILEIEPREGGHDA
jgi:hypothetical protein